MVIHAGRAAQFVVSIVYLAGGVQIPGKHESEVAARR
jgi:hypothetical protein